MNHKDYDTGYQWEIHLKDGDIIVQKPGIKVEDYDYRLVDKFLLRGNLSLMMSHINGDLIYFRRVIRSYNGELKHVIVFWGTRTILYEINPFSDTYIVHTDDISDVIGGSVGCYGETNITSQDLIPEK